MSATIDHPGDPLYQGEINRQLAEASAENAKLRIQVRQLREALTTLWDDAGEDGITAETWRTVDELLSSDPEAWREARQP